MDDKVGITGTGIVCCLGTTQAEVWDALLAEGLDRRSDTACAVTGFPGKSFCVPDLDPSVMGIHPREARIMDRHAYMLMKASQDAYVQAGLGESLFPREDIGFFAGMGMVDYRIEDLLPAVLTSLVPQGAFSYDIFYQRGFKEIYPLWPLSMLNNISFCQVATRLDIRGENAVFSPHADSGGQAIIEGMACVCSRRSRVVIAGGVSEKISPASLARAHICGLGGPGLEGERNDAGHERGITLGEGCGMIAIELLSSARERDLPCLAVITGYGSAFDADDKSPGPTAHALALSMREALERAHITSRDIDLVMAQGDGRGVSDVKEREAVHEIFSGRIESVPVVSAHGVLGHLLSGSPSVALVIGTAVMKHGIIPSALRSAFWESPETAAALTPRQPLPLNPKRIMVNAYSAEGQCSSLIIEAGTG
jgi:3-oxoacyl-[acyl-carrier-protein] synthase II